MNLSLMPIAPRLAALFTVLTLAACAAPGTTIVPPPVPGYEAIEERGFFVPEVDPALLTGDVARAEVAYSGKDKPGTVVIDTFARKLYLVEPDGKAIRYTIAVGRAGLGFRGSAIVGRKVEWPSWTPTANMVRTMPEFYAEYAGGLPGGVENPLGARAMYLYRNGKDTYFRIHGTVDNHSIGRATSAGCIRLFNRDALHLYERVKIGALVRVRSEAESIEMEGRKMDDVNGRPIPYSEEGLAEVAAQKAAAEAQKAADAAALAAAPATEG